MMSEEPFGESERRRSRSLVGPLVLILVGVALLLNELDIWTLDWSRVWRLWPLILIFVGLDIILGKARLGGIIFLLVAAAVVVLLVLFLPSGEEPGAGYERRTFSYPVKGLEAANIELHPGAARLRILPARDSDQLVEVEAEYDTRRSRTRIVQDLDVTGDVARVSLTSQGDTVGWVPFTSGPAEEWRVWLTSESAPAARGRFRGEPCRPRPDWPHADSPGRQCRDRSNPRRAIGQRRL